VAAISELPFFVFLWQSHQQVQINWCVPTRDFNLTVIIIIVIVILVITCDGQPGARKLSQPQISSIFLITDGSGVELLLEENVPIVGAFWLKIFMIKIIIYLLLY
jgi:hypothetical protein